MPGNTVPGNNRKFINEISCVHPVPLVVNEMGMKYGYLYESIHEIVFM